MHLTKRRPCVVIKAEQKKKDAMKKERIRKGKHTHHINMVRLKRHTATQKRCERDFRRSEAHVAILEKMLSNAKKTLAVKTRAITRFKCPPTKKSNHRVSKALQMKIHGLLASDETHHKQGASPRLLCNMADVSRSLLPYQAQVDSCVLTSLVIFCQVILKDCLVLELDTTMMTALLHENCTRSSNLGYKITEVIRDFSVCMNSNRNQIYARNHKNTLVQVGFKLVLRAMTPEKQDITAFLNTKEARKGLFLVYERISDTITHTLVGQGGEDGFYVIDPEPKQRKFISVASVRLVVVLEICEIYTRPVMEKNAEWTSHKAPNFPQVPEHWPSPNPA